MIRLTKKLLFAIEAVLDIAYNGGQAPVRSSEITERQGIPRRGIKQRARILTGSASVGVARTNSEFLGF